MAVTNPLGIDLDQYKYGFHDPEQYAFKSRKGLDREIVEMISHMKSEPEWMRAFRLHSLGVWEKKPLPTWGGNVGEIDFDDIYYYVRPMENQGKTWDDVPENIKKTFDRLGIPRRRRSTWPAWAPSTTRSSTTACARGVNEAGRGLPGDGLHAARVSGHRQGILRDGHPARGQQVRGPQQLGMERGVICLRPRGRAR